MKRNVLITAIVIFVGTIALLAIRWTTLPALVKKEIILEAGSRRYYSLGLELAEFEQIEKIVVYNGFLSFDETIKEESKLQLISNQIISKIASGEFTDNSINLTGQKAYIYGNEEKLIGLAVKRNNSWTVNIKNGQIQADNYLNDLLIKNKKNAR